MMASQFTVNSQGKKGKPGQKLKKHPKKAKPKAPQQKKKPVAMPTEEPPKSPKEKLRLPSFMYPTGSIHVFVAKLAVDRLPPGTVDPPTLFDHCFTNVQRSFVHVPSQLAADASLREVAFLGRSNVGKSSLLNALMRMPLARTSKQPGRTQEPHCYHMSLTPSPQVVGSLVDLPGYGYAVGPDTAVDAWQASTQDWLLRRRDSGHLARVYLLLDSRRDNVTSVEDQTVWSWLDEADMCYTIVFTKSDAVVSSSTQHYPAGVIPAGLPLMIQRVNHACMLYTQKKTMMYEDDNNEDGDDKGEDDYDDNEQINIERYWMGMSPLVHITSSKTGLGMAELWKSIDMELGLE
jgi:ribosome biogenesis GTP-binding protein YsxC/EngB